MQAILLVSVAGVLADEAEAPEFSEELLKAVIEAERGNSCASNSLAQRDPLSGLGGQGRAESG